MEDYIQSPNLPVGRVSLAVVDGRIPSDIEGNLTKRGIRIIKTNKLDGLYEGISHHPDIMIHHIGGRDIIAAPNLPDSFIYNLQDEGFNIIMGKREIGVNYPYDVPYNVVRLGKYVICNMNTIDENILHFFQKNSFKIINVRQGYTKCSVCIVSQKALITSDFGIAKCLQGTDIECLFITPGYIKLSGLNYGFIGGSSGYISGNELAFYGDISLHPDFKKINSFLYKHGKTAMNLSKNTLMDLGTLLPLREYSIM